MKCRYCERLCDIPEDMNGYCRMYSNTCGIITENYPDAYLNVYPVSSESIPLLHFYPNGVFLLISTIGCNFACEGCYSEFQTTRKGTLQEVLTSYSPEDILTLARESNCIGITFCLNEPTVSLPTFLRVAEAAKKENLLVGCSSNGYMTDETVKSLIPYLDFVNIGLKGSTDERYRECGVLSGEPVFRNVRAFHEAGVWVEVSTMYLYGREDEVFGAAERIQEISNTIPFQVMRFMSPNEELKDLSPDREQGENLCIRLRKILDHVYLFNTPATTELDSRCPVCNEIIIHRVFFGPMAARVLSCMPDGVCSCGYTFPCRGPVLPLPDEDSKILGGYRSILGVKFIARFFRILGVTDEMEIDRLCNTVIANGYLRALQEEKDSVETFVNMIRYLAGLSGQEKQGEEIIAYATAIVQDVKSGVIKAKKPRVLTVFCHPLSPMYAKKFVNTEVEMAGGISLNIEQDFKESENAEYTVEALNRLNPEIILVSGPFAPTLDEFIVSCNELGVSCQALDEKRVYPLDDEYTSGALGWVIGLMDIANLLHPDIFHYDLEEEKKRLDMTICGVDS